MSSPYSVRYGYCQECVEPFSTLEEAHARQVALMKTWKPSTMKCAPEVHGDNYDYDNPTGLTAEERDRLDELDSVTEEPL